MKIPQKQIFIIDTDTGVDDAIALMIALSSTKIETIAITTVSGNANVNQVTDNVCRILDTLEYKTIPIFSGSHHPLLNQPYPLPNLMGEDGLGNLVKENKLPSTSRKIESEHAAIALIRLVKENASKGYLSTIVALGPLTNIALAVRLDPQFVSYISRLFIMGGAIEAKGNTSAVAEFNFFVDPESAAIVLEAGFLDINILPWETSIKYLLNWHEYENITSSMTTKAILFKNITHYTKQILENTFKLPGMPLPDPLTMAIALEPQIIKQAHHVFAAVETSGRISRGLLSVDWNPSEQNKPNAHIITEIDFDNFKQILSTCLS